ncbi:hypothetical protein [Streptomyces liangshanensis]|uniref:hypothetical protein n=1 Tax=Streptomyces liangshanensis TaxID=2717324 RepID=UPI0036D88D43
MRDRIRAATTTAAAEDNDLLALATVVGVLRPSRTAPLLLQLPAGFAPDPLESALRSAFDAGQPVDDEGQDITHAAERALRGGQI